MQKKLTTSGLVVVGIGIVISIIGLILFLTVFFAILNQMNNHFDTGFGPWMSFGARQSIPFSRAVIGVLLSGIGGFLVKAGLGMSIVGSSNSIAAWIRGLIHGHDTKPSMSKTTCPNCNNPIASDAVYCSHCGQKLR